MTSPGEISYHPLPAVIRALSPLGRVLGWAFSTVPTKERAIAELQLRRILPLLKTRQTVRSLYGNLGASIIESILLACFMPVIRPAHEPPDHPEEKSVNSLVITATPNCSDVAPDQWQTLHRLLDTPSGRGVLCLTGHVGNWDLLGARIASSGIPLTVIGREARNPVLHRLLVWLRNRAGLHTIWRNEKGALKSLVRALSTQGIVAALIDQDTHVDSIMSPFFGVPAKTPSALIELALRLNCSIFSAFYVRQSNGTFKFEIRELYVSERSKEPPPSPTVYSIANAYHTHLEEVIRQYPDQWVWMHKRWRTLVAAPSNSGQQESTLPGKTLSGKEYLQYLTSEEFRPGGRLR